MREAFLKAKIGESVGHAVKGLAERVGLKEKTGAKELERKSQVNKR